MVTLGRAGSTWLPYIPSPHERGGVEPFRPQQAGSIKFPAAPRVWEPSKARARAVLRTKSPHAASLDCGRRTSEASPVVLGHSLDDDVQARRVGAASGTTRGAWRTWHGDGAEPTSRGGWWRP